MNARNCQNPVTPCFPNTQQGEIQTRIYFTKKTLENKGKEMQTFPLRIGDPDPLGSKSAVCLTLLLMGFFTLSFDESGLILSTIFLLVKTIDFFYFYF